MAQLLAGTASGVFELSPGGAAADAGFGVRDATGFATRDGVLWVVADRRTLMRRDGSGAWKTIAESDDLDVTCVAVTSTGAFLGTEEAHLLRVSDGKLARDEAFEAVEDRSSWYTPWGGPPAVRSIGVDLAERIHVNVHVGGIPRSVDGGSSWEPTIDIDADVHQVIAHPTEPDTVLAAGAVGLALSRDGGSTWRVEQTGLPSTYARAVAVAGDALLLSASSGPRGGRAGVHRSVSGPEIRFEKCAKGLPEWFDGNIDTGWLVADGPVAAFATLDRRVFVSDDAGERWRQETEDLPTVRWLSLR